MKQRAYKCFNSFIVCDMRQRTVLMYIFRIYKCRQCAHRTDCSHPLPFSHLHPGLLRYHWGYLHARTFGKQDSKSAVKLPLELAAYEAAEQRVDAGDEAAEAHLQGEGHLCRAPGGGVVRVDCSHHDGCVAAQVVGQVKQCKEDQRCAQHPPEPPLLVVWVGAAGPAAQLQDTA